jgi:hypothetical protein
VTTVVSFTTVTFPSVVVVVTIVTVETGVFDTSVLFTGFETSWEMVSVLNVNDKSLFTCDRMVSPNKRLSFDLVIWKVLVHENVISLP